MFQLLKNKWKEYTIELFLVMLGIVIPFLIYKWNENLHEKKLEIKYKEMLIEDLKEDLNVLEYNRRDIIADQEAIFSFLNSYNKSNSIDEKKLKDIVPRVVKYYHFIPINSTFKELESTGNLSLISSIENRKILYKYVRLTELIVKMENAYELETEQYLKPTILKIFPMRRLSQYDFEYSNSEKFPIQYEKIINSVEFENALLIKNDLLNNLRRTTISLIELNKETTKMLLNEKK